MKWDITGCFLDRIGQMCFHVREGSGEAFARKQPVGLDMIGHKSGQKRVHGERSRSLAKLIRYDRANLGVLWPKSGIRLILPLHSRSSANHVKKKDEGVYQKGHTHGAEGKISFRWLSPM